MKGRATFLTEVALIFKATVQADVFFIEPYDDPSLLMRCCRGRQIVATGAGSLPVLGAAMARILSRSQRLCARAPPDGAGRNTRPRQKGLVAQISPRHGTRQAGDPGWTHVPVVTCLGLASVRLETAARLPLPCPESKPYAQETAEC
jgi:hypothetical protein